MWPAGGLLTNYVAGADIVECISSLLSGCRWAFCSFDKEHCDANL